MELSIICGNCYAVLDGGIDNKGNLQVDLCSACEKRIRKEGYESGHDEGYEIGLNEAE